MVLYNLSSDQFRVGGQQHQTLMLDPPGNFFVFFKVRDCGACSAFTPIFSILAGETTHANFGVMDMTSDRKIISMSRGTSTVIQEVPSVIFYVDGMPRARYTAKPKTLISARNFVSEMLTSTRSQQQSFVSSQNFYGGNQPQNTGYAQPTAQPSRAAINMASPQQGGVFHASMKQCEPEDENCLGLPKQIVPHNMPWEIEYKR